MALDTGRPKKSGRLGEAAEVGWCVIRIQSGRSAAASEFHFVLGDGFPASRPGAGLVGRAGDTATHRPFLIIFPELKTRWGWYLG